MTHGNEQRARWTHRLLAVAFYLGLGPWLWVFCLRGDKRFLRHHFLQSLIISLLLVVLLIYYLLTYSASAYLLLHHRDLYQSLSKSVVFWLLVDVLSRVLGLVWVLLWSVAITLAVQGSTWGIPLVASLARLKMVVSAGSLVSSPLYFAVLLAVGIVFHASSLTDGALRAAPVYMLYDDMGYVPRWVFDLGFYRVSRAATARWGRGSVVVAPLSRESLEVAFENGRFVFVASHGGGGRISATDLTYGPEDAGTVAVNRNLAFVYLAGCEAGLREAEWKAALSPAEVISFRRISRLGEHLRWLWFHGPSRLRAIP